MRQNIPQELRALHQWVCAGTNKLPLNPRTGQMASVTDSNTWGSFEEACATGLPYIGFVLTPQDPYTIIDLDNKPEKPATPEQLQRHTKILEAFASYTERSASGHGYHIIVKGRIPAGMHRDNVEVYSDGRYMVCTGDVVRQMPIVDHQPLLDVLFNEMKPQATVELDESYESDLSDAEIVDRAMNAANGEKFNTLCNGDQTGYESQSEADFALLSIIAFYTKDNEQVRRIFRMTALGKRDKANRNDTYLNFALGKIRAHEPPPVDFTALKESADLLAQRGAADDSADNRMAALPPTAPERPATAAPQGVPAATLPIPPAPSANAPIPLPPGLIGEMAQYFYSTAIRPVPEVALMAAIALTAGVAARSYNISGSGLNQYLILLAKTGSGKEGALSGIENLLSAVRPQVPMVYDFLGPGAFASGQALVKTLNDKPCFVSVLGEFGLTLQQLSDARANSAQVMLRKVLLDLYAKSGWNRHLQANVYSDSDKNTKVIQAPNVTIFGESTPETFFDGLDSSHIAEGLIPRFSIIEYNGDRPPRNEHANCPPSPQLCQRFVDLVTVALSTTNNNTCCPVAMDAHAKEKLDSFDRHADATMNGTRNEVEVQLWNRAHLKALKLAALLAVGCNPHSPVVDSNMAQWSIDFVLRDISMVAGRFAEGDVGKGDSKQYIDLKRTLKAYFEASDAQLDKYGVQPHIRAAGIIPYQYLIRRTASIASFRNDRNGSTIALKKMITAMVDSGVLVEIPKPDLLKKFKFSGTAFGVGDGWR